jgi:hypothetical protein
MPGGYFCLSFNDLDIYWFYNLLIPKTVKFFDAVGGEYSTAKDSGSG